MKKIVLAVVAILLVMTGRSQPFEGTIRWKMQLDITDPKAKAEIEEAKKKAADPKNQAAVKEMMAKMNDPQFKAMMDANPQLKAQMETMMKTMMTGDMSAMIPTGIAIKGNGGNTLTSIEGGIMDKTDILYLGEKNETYMISHNAKTFKRVPKSDGNAAQEKPKVTKTSETATILNYNCTKYIIEIKGQDGKPVTSNAWYTTELKVDLQSVVKQLAKGQSIAIPDIDGTPLRTEFTMPQTGTLTMEATEVKLGPVSASLFQLPSGYTENK